MSYAEYQQTQELVTLTQWVKARLGSNFLPRKAKDGGQRAPASVLRTDDGRQISVESVELLVELIDNMEEDLTARAAALEEDL